MFTTQFKVALAAMAGIAILGGVVYNQMTLQQRVNVADVKLQMLMVTPSVTPMVTPTATPTASLKFVPRGGVVTVVPTKTK